MENYFNLIEEDLSKLKIVKNTFDCILQDSDWKSYKWFILSISTNKKSYTICDVNFHIWSEWKYTPRLTFRKTNENLQNREVERNNEFKIIRFDRSEDWYKEFWEMIWFLNSFKDIIDLWEFENNYSVISKNITIDNISEWYDESPDICQDLLIKLLSSKWKISWQDLQNLIDRKEQFRLFKWIVENNQTIINDLKIKYWTSQTEKTIESFLKDNSWILWLSLDSVQYNGIDETLDKIKRVQEQVQGWPEHNFDIVTETTVLNIVELKLADKKLFNFWLDSHNNPKWNPDFFEYVTQIQNYKRVLEQIWDSPLIPIWKKVIFPSTYLIVWKLSDMDENQKKVFDMYRKNLKEPKIFTYDELLERAEKIANSNDIDLRESLEDLPF